MNILVACEYSGAVREAFAKKGHRVLSCDLLPTEQECSETAEHYTGDISDVINDGWDMMLAFPPCTHLAVSGARWFKDKRADGRQQAAIEFFLKLTRADIPMIAIENPVGIMSSNYRKPDQVIQPWMFGHGETKATCLWLEGLPKLMPTNVVPGREQRIWKLPPSEDRWKERSRTFQGIADAMADQWSEHNQQLTIFVA